MSNIKRALLAIIPLALMLVIWVVFTSMQLIHNRTNTTDTLTYEDGQATNNVHNNQHLKNQNIEPDTQKSTVPSNKTKDEHNDTLLDPWQNSHKIKHTKYKKPATSNQQVDEEEQDTDIKTTHEKVPTKTNSDSGVQSLIDAWGWAPSSQNNKVKAPTQPTVESVELASIKSFGNAYGARVKQFTNLAGDQSQILKEIVDSRGTEHSEAARQAITQLADEYTLLSTELADIQAPTGFVDAAHKLTESYGNISTALLQLRDSVGTDAELLKQIYTYNKTVDGFANDFLRMAELFGAYGIRFERHQGGDIFTPPM